MTSGQELRLECYRMSAVCTGRSPDPIQPGEYNLIPPKYVPYVPNPSEASSLTGQLGLDTGCEAKEVIMSDQVCFVLRLLLSVL